MNTIQKCLFSFLRLSTYQAAHVQQTSLLEEDLRVLFKVYLLRLWLQISIFWKINLFYISKFIKTCIFKKIIKKYMLLILMELYIVKIMKIMKEKVKIALFYLS